MVAFATGPGRVASDGSGRNGVFTEALLRYMGAPGLELRDVLKQTRIEVARRTGDAQVPWENTSVMGRFYFVPGAGEIAPVPVVTQVPAAAPHAGERRTVDLGDGVSLELVWCPPGEFLMGSPEGEEGRFDDEGPQHRVRISRGFWMGIYEVTNAQYARYKPDHASGEYDGLSLSDPDQPVVRVGWEDAVGFANWVSRRTDETFRLPTEAEWEYACRAGSTTPAPWGRLDATTGQHANVADRTAKARWSDWSIVETVDGHEVSALVGTYRPNGFGLHDMIGNVWEWCEDDWHDGYTGAPSDGTAWVDAPRGSDRVSRGGSWFNSPRFCRSAGRCRDTPEYRNGSLGFRVVLPAVQ